VTAALPRPFRALAHRDYRLFWCGQLVSLVGTWMQSVGQAWLVLELTNSPLRLGLISTLQFGPILLLSFVGGAVSDRFPKRRLLVATQSLLMLQAFCLAGLAWHGHVQYWHVAVLATLYGLANTVDMPTRQSFLTDLVGRADVMSAIALNSAVFNGARVIGPAVAGLLVARWGPAIAFLVNGASFLGVIVALLALRTEGAPRPRPGGGLRSELAEGLRYATGTPRIALVLGLLLSMSLFVINFNVLVPLIARDVLGQGARGFGLLMTALGVGAVAGALTVATLGLVRPPLAMLVTAALALPGATLVLATARTFGLAAAVLAVIGFIQILFVTSCNTTLQVTAPDHLRGRVMGLYALVFAGMTPIGALLIGALAERFGPPAACALAASTGLTAVLALTLTLGRRASTPPP
jgi:MFS family permease